MNEQNLSGIIVVKKEKGFTSHDVVAKLRGICKQRKIGHTGTLDPDATGVLPVCLGRATKVCDMLTDSDKTYETVMLLGVTTDTQDTSGEILEEKAIETLDEESVLKAIFSFIGDYEQIPPMYSALKVNGQKLCDLARKGIEVERKARKISIYSIDVIEIRLPYVKMRVSCSKGTYIRTLCHDIGLKLGVGACMKELSRTKAAGFCMEEAHTLSEIETIVKAGNIHSLLIPVDRVFESYPSVTVKKDFEIIYKNGNPLEQRMLCGDSAFFTHPVRVYDETGIFIGIFQYKSERNLYFPVKMFLN